MSPRLRYLVSSFLIGVMGVGLAWAGSVLAPPPLAGSRAEGQTQQGAGTRATAQLAASEFTGELAAGQVLAGAAKASIEPRPQEWGGVWETENCKTLGDEFMGAQDHVADFRVRWLENSNCIYMGGYGIGPMNPITNWTDPYGLYVRSVAIGDGTDTVVLTILDGVYYFSDYNTMCDDCGFTQLAAELGGELGIGAQNFMFASTHSHTSADFIGGWGGVPQWYMDQVADALRASVKAAVASMRPAVVEVGETLARQFSSERRDFYRSAEEYGLTWFRLLESGAPTPDAPIDYSCVTDCPSPSEAPEGSDGSARSEAQPIPVNTPNGCDPSGGKPRKCPTPTPTPSEEPTPEPTVEPTPEPTPSDTDQLRAIATIGAFANHPVTADESTGIADADFPGVFGTRVEELFGGVGLYFQTGFGNVSPRTGEHSEGSSDKEKIGFGMASLLPDLGTSRILQNADVRAGQTFWDQPVTNSGLAALGLPGFFDRPFNQTPAQVQAGKNSNKNCKSASPISVRTLVSAAKIGDLWITGAPGEIFSNYSNTIKEKNPTGVTMPLSLVNDGLGYIMQSFETDHAGRQVLGFVGEVVEYEDAYSIDACFGDMALETTLNLLGSL